MFSPQHQIPPEAKRAQEWRVPAATSKKLSSWGSASCGAVVVVVTAGAAVVVVGGDVVVGAMVVAVLLVLGTAVESSSSLAHPATIRATTAQRVMQVRFMDIPTFKKVRETIGF